MALWWTALKVIPWGDVIEKAPAVVAGARRLFTSARKPPVPGAGVLPTGPDALRQQLQALQAEQEATAQLLASLAEQNAKIVEAIEILRLRSRLLGALVVALLVVVVWLAVRGSS